MAAHSMAFVAQWLVCLWQARALHAAWWEVLVILLVLVAVETLLMPPRRAVPQRGWPELVRACVTLVFVYWVCMVLFGGRTLGTLLLLLAGWALLPFAPVPYAEIALPIMDGVGFVVAVLSSSSVLGTVEEHPVREPGAAGWVHLVCVLHLLLVSNRHEAMSVWRMGVSVVGLPLMLGLYPAPTLIHHAAPWLLLLLPSVGMHMQQLVGQYIAPIVETLCQPSCGQQVRVRVFYHFIIRIIS